MHLAVDTATFSLRRFGLFLVIAGLMVGLVSAIRGSFPGLWAGAALIGAGALLFGTRIWVMRHPAMEVRDRMNRSLTLLGLPYEEVERASLLRVPPLRIDFHSFGSRNTIVRFRSHHHAAAGKRQIPDQLVIDALIKTQKKVRIII